MVRCPGAGPANANLPSIPTEASRTGRRLDPEWRTPGSVEAFLPSGTANSHSVDENLIIGRQKRLSGGAIRLSGMMICSSRRPKRGYGSKFRLSGTAFWSSGKAPRAYGRAFCCSGQKKAALRRLPALAFGERSDASGAGRFGVAAGLGPAAGQFLAGGVQALFAAGDLEQA